MIQAIINSKNTSISTTVSDSKVSNSFNNMSNFNTDDNDNQTNKEPFLSSLAANSKIVGKFLCVHRVHILTHTYLNTLK